MKQNDSFDWIKECERLEKINADLLEAIKLYMAGHKCLATDECPSKNKALQAITKAEGRN